MKYPNIYSLFRDRVEHYRRRDVFYVREVGRWEGISWDRFEGEAHRFACALIAVGLARGGHVCSGYWQNSEATAAAISDGWFYTGDLARQDEDGYYYLVGRAKDMIISGGENIYPAEVEAVLHSHTAVANAALIGLPDPKWGETPVAVVIARKPYEVTADEIIEFCSGRLARYKIPKQVFFVEEFPLLASGKVFKRVLKEQIENLVNGG
ncbi:MAG TPA: hypothetical protein VD966_07080 [Pyrinomonadaceae bacterium]|nr:hypothetical protein [Pyrinomonadaceae bacterium]